MNNILQESGLSRVASHMAYHDCGTITAFRNEYSLKENKQRNKNLLAYLLDWGYDATAVKGTYIENFDTPEAIEVSEETYFVVDSKDQGTLEDDLRNLGEEFDQDSILFIPCPGDESILWGTNHTAEFPGYNKYVEFKHRGMGISGQFMTKVKNRPFIFESFIRDIPKPQGYLGRMAVHRYSEMNWRDIPIDD